MQRQTELQNWLESVYPNQPFELSFAAADADFRRYFRATFSDGQTVICMDAPPEKMSVAPYLKVQKLFNMVNVPQVLHVDEALGFMVLNDLGNTTFLTAMNQENSETAHKALLLEAIDELIELQKASQPGKLPEYDREVMLREINLFPEWFVAKELGRELTFKQRQLWQQTVDTLLPPLLAQPKVYVHRDFIVRNLMLAKGRPGVLDFQDALYGPISYDLVSLLRDAFIEWEEEFVLDLVIRYWEKARAAQLPVPAEFDEFYRWFEWMGVQRHLKVQKLFNMVNVPQVLHVDEALGFRVLNDLGNTTFLTAMNQENSETAHKALLLEAIDELIELQKASQPGKLPEYDREVMLREINLFPEWFVAKELGRELTFKQRQLWQQTVDTLLPPLLAQPKVYVHRDFIVRNLMLAKGRPGVLDFQDALYGPISYDLVSLLRDAFIEWEEEFVLDLVIRYWEKARAAELPVPAEFDEFYRWFEWMGVQRHLKVAGIFARLYYRDGKDKYRPEIPRFLNYLRRVSRRYNDLAPLYALLVELVGDDELETGYTF